MIAEPKVRQSWQMRDGQLVEGPLEVRDLVGYTIEDGLFIECGVTHPTSMTRRSVTLRIRPEQADAMLRALREYGIARRQQGRAS